MGPPREGSLAGEEASRCSKLQAGGPARPGEGERVAEEGCRLALVGWGPGCGLRVTWGHALGRWNRRAGSAQAGDQAGGDRHQDGGGGPSCGRRARAWCQLPAGPLDPSVRPAVCGLRALLTASFRAASFVICTIRISRLRPSPAHLCAFLVMLF